MKINVKKTRVNETINETLTGRKIKTEEIAANNINQKTVRGI